MISSIKGGVRLVDVGLRVGGLSRAELMLGVQVSRVKVELARSDLSTRANENKIITYLRMVRERTTVRQITVQVRVRQRSNC